MSVLEAKLVELTAQLQQRRESVPQWMTQQLEEQNRAALGTLMSSADAHRHDPTHPVHARRRSSSRYPVEVIRSDKRNKTVSARIVDGVIRVRIPAWMTAEDEARFVDDVVERIERERRSKVILAEGEYQAAAKLTEAAQVLAESPGAMQLRYLNSLQDIAGDGGPGTTPLPRMILEEQAIKDGPGSLFTKLSSVHELDEAQAKTYAAHAAGTRK